jgi:hypothetical protein
MLHPRFVIVCALAWPALATGEETPARKRAISAHLAEVLAAKLPAYDSTQRVAPKPAEVSPVLNDGVAPDPNIVRLPTVIVSDRKLPTAESVRTGKAIAEIAMNQYLGPSDGLDRGLLNAKTVAEYWRKVPLLGTLLPSPFGIMTNEERAMRIYRDEEHYRAQQKLLDLGRITTKAGDPALGEKIKRETQRIYIMEDARRDYGR